MSLRQTAPLGSRKKTYGSNHPLIEKVCSCLRFLLDFHVGSLAGLEKIFHYLHMFLRPQPVGKITQICRPNGLATQTEEFVLGMMQQYLGSQFTLKIGAEKHKANVCGHVHCL